MTAFELALVILNLFIAAIHAAILWVMVQQRRLMDKQLEAMQSQIHEAERTRMAAHRPILRVEPPIASGLTNLKFHRVHNFWTLYDPLEQTHSFGEGEPPCLKR